MAFFLRDLQALRSHLAVQLDVVVPFFRHVAFVVDSLDGALRNACSAVDALYWVNEDDRLALVKTLGRALDNAVCILTAETRFGHDHCHGCLLNWAQRKCVCQVNAERWRRPDSGFEFFLQKVRTSRAGRCLQPGSAGASGMSGRLESLSDVT